MVARPFKPVQGLARTVYEIQALATIVPPQALAPIQYEVTDPHQIHKLSSSRSDDVVSIAA